VTEVEPELAAHIKRLEHIKLRYSRGDALYSRDTVGVLLAEIAILSERALGAAATNWPEQAKVMREAMARPVAERCQARAKKGTGEGPCDAPILNGYCPQWRNHLEED
jgi:hypothetical protein